MKHTHERLVAALDDFYDLSFAATASVLLSASTFLSLLPLSCDRTSHNVPVQGSAGLGCLDEHIIVRLALDDHEDIAIPCHLNLSGHLGQHFLALLSGTEPLVAALPAAVLATLAISSFLHR